MQLELNSIKENKMQIDTKMYIEKIVVILVLKKKKISKEIDPKKIVFHSSLLNNWLNIFQFGVIQRIIYET
jgi:hypothetical protein